MSVRELIALLKKHPPEARVVCEVWESCMTDSGTDMGGDAEFNITGLVDLNSRVVLQTERA